MPMFAPSRLVSRVLSFLLFTCALGHAASVVTERVPGEGIQPQVAVDEQGTVHLIYLRGEPSSADIFYVRSADNGKTFSQPVRVNSQPGSAVAAGTIRGAQLAIGKNGRVHVAWNGSATSGPRGPLNPEMPADNPHNGLPMLYTRMNDGGTAFEKQRNLMQRTFALDGGGSLTADSDGSVYVGWHGNAIGGAIGEAGRRVWIARSRDEGNTFSVESAASSTAPGACGCCGLRLFGDRDNNLYGLFRSATNNVNRDIYLLVSTDGGDSFREKRIHQWNINACPMSAMAFAETESGVIPAWETEEQIYFSSVGRGSLEVSEPAPMPGQASRRKHPATARNSEGELILVWTENTGWNKGGSLAWQVFDKQGRPSGKQGRLDGVPAWSFGAAFARPDGGFTVLY